MPDAAMPNDPLELQLDKLRIAIDLQIDALEVHLGIMRRYRFLGDDDGLARATDETRDRMRGVLSMVGRLNQGRQTANVSRQAAVEFRDARPRRKA